VLKNALRSVGLEDISEPNIERAPIDLRKQHNSVLYQKEMSIEFCICYMDWLQMMQLRRKALFTTDEEDISYMVQEEAEEIYDE
jgi:hypothetical protein